MTLADVMQALDKISAALTRIEKAQKTPPRSAYRPREVSQMTGIGYKRVLELLDAGEIRAVRDGHLWYVPAAAVEEYLSRGSSTLRRSA